MSHEAGKQALLKLLKTKLGTGGTLKDEVIEIGGIIGTRSSSY